MHISPSSSPTSSATRRKLVIDIGILAAVAALGILAFYASPLLAPRSDVSLPVSDCDLGSGPCAVTLPTGGVAEIELSPRPIPALRPLQVSVALRDSNADKVEVDFAGVDMQMGFNRPQLTPAADGRFNGTTSLPVCVTGSMPWQATVMIHSGRSIIAVPFRFDVRG